MGKFGASRQDSVGFSALITFFMRNSRPNSRSAHAIISKLLQTKDITANNKEDTMFMSNPITNTPASGQKSQFGINPHRVRKRPKRRLMFGGGLAGTLVLFLHCGLPWLG